MTAKPDPNLIDHIAQAMAEGTNGGDYHDSRWYSEEHRQLWRKRANIALDALASWRPGNERDDFLERHLAEVSQKETVEP